MCSTQTLVEIYNSYHKIKKNDALDKLCKCSLAQLCTNINNIYLKDCNSLFILYQSVRVLKMRTLHLSTSMHWNLRVIIHEKCIAPATFKHQIYCLLLQKRSAFSLRFGKTNWTQINARHLCNGWNEQLPLARLRIVVPWDLDKSLNCPPAGGWCPC